MGAPSQRAHRTHSRGLLILNDYGACHSGVNGAEILVLTGRLEFVRKPLIGVKGHRGK